MLGALGAAGLAFGAAGALTPDALAQVNIEEIFWCNAGEMTGQQTEEECIAARELVLVNCTACHSFVPIVKAQKDEGAWLATLNPHRERMEGEVTDEEYEQITLFLQAHYNPENEPPQLPPELEALADIPQ